ALRTHVQIPDELLTEIRVIACLALLPRVRRDLEPFAPGEAGLLLFTEPGHVAKCDAPRHGRQGSDDRSPSRGTAQIRRCPSCPRPSAETRIRTPMASQLASMNEPP